MVNNQSGEAAEASASPSPSPARSAGSRVPDIDGAYKIALLYALWTVATIVALVIMSFTAKSLAQQRVGHTVIVAIFAFVLPLRMRAVRKNPTARGVRAGIAIAAVLGVVNLAEACLPAFPVWMRAEMIVIVLIAAAMIAMLTGRLRLGT